MLNQALERTGVGAEILRPMAAPVLGGILIADEVVDLSVPALFYWLRLSRWRAARSVRAGESGVQPELATAGKGVVSG
jgi:hypothetical protein